MGLVVDKILYSFQSLLIKILSVWVISNWQNARTDIWVTNCWFYISVLVLPSCGRLVPITLNQTKTEQKTLLSVFPLLLASKQSHFIAVFLEKKEQEIGLIVSSFRVPADELVCWSISYYLKWFHKVSLPALHSDEQCGGSPLLWLFLFEQVITILLPGFSLSDERSYSSEKVALCDSDVKTAARFSSAEFCWAVMSLALMSKIIFGCKEWFIRIIAASRYIILLVLWLIKQD